MRRIRWLAAIVVFAVGCTNPFGCTEEREVLEISDRYLDGNVASTLARYKKDGWSCYDDGKIRDFLGRSLLTRYVCTRCK